MGQIIFCLTPSRKLKLLLLANRYRKLSGISVDVGEGLAMKVCDTDENF